MKIPFMKMSGSGNDFILIDHREPFLKEDRLTDFVRKVCRRRISVGADGLILIERSKRADFKWRFIMRMEVKQKCAETEAVVLPALPI